jgi:hypothetical protein
MPLALDKFYAVSVGIADDEGPGAATGGRELRERFGVADGGFAGELEALPFPG